MIRPLAVPGALAGRAQLMLIVADLVALAFAATIIRLTKGKKSDSTTGVATVLTVTSLATCALYRRSFATAPQDECYAMAVPGLLALGSFFLISALPGVTLDRNIGSAALAYSFAGCALLRALLHDRTARITPHVGSEAVPQTPDTVQQALKRIMDLTLTALLAPFAAIVGIAVALVIVLDGDGPVFFIQQRVGRNGRPFRLFKFRTMRRAAGDAWAVVDDPRITRVGRFLRGTSLDELPQLINVFRGEMSLVGPRPEMIEYAQKFARRLARYDERVRVKPGITGWAQVTLPRVLTDDDIADVLAADLFYIANGSFVLDGAILAKTAFEVLFHRVA